MTEEKKKLLHEISSLLCQAYNELIENNQVSFPLYDEQVFKIDTVVKTVYASYFGFVPYPTEKDRAAAFFCLIIKDHVVTDGNKRLATMWLEIYCNTFSLKISNSMPLDQLAVSVEAEKDLSLQDLVQSVKVILFD
ncbi:MAG: Fido protein [Patescibacteria group bacterium]|jgi:hypothetical protein|nr:Fido protein [Patescibacteria group bacterium]